MNCLCNVECPDFGVLAETCRTVHLTVERTQSLGLNAFHVCSWRGKGFQSSSLLAISLLDISLVIMVHSRMVEDLHSSSEHSQFKLYKRKREFYLPFGWQMSMEMFYMQVLASHQLCESPKLGLGSWSLRCVPAFMWAVNW